MPLKLSNERKDKLLWLTMTIGSPMRQRSLICSCVARRYKYYFKTTKGEEQPRRYDNSSPHTPLRRRVSASGIA